MPVLLKGVNWGAAMVVFIACAGAAPADHAPAPSAEPVPYLYVARIGGAVGGLPARTESVYLSADGVAQRAVSSGDGTLHSLWQSTGHGGDFEHLGDELTALMAAIGTRRERSADAGDAGDAPLAEYKPAVVFVAVRASEGDTSLTSFPDGEEPAVLSALWQNLEEISPRTQQTALPPGLYLRADRVPQGRRPDVVLTGREIAPDSVTMRILSAEYLFLVADRGTLPGLATAAEALRGRPMFVRWEEGGDGGALWLVGAYRLAAP